jgi:hypothetical protein
MKCYECKHRGTIAGNCHSKCNNPDAKVTGDPHGIRNGWFFFPINFDPVWLQSCTGFEQLPAKETK